MKICEGAYYRTRGGDVVGPMRHDAPGSKHPWQTLFQCWTKGGAHFVEGKEHIMDLISEVYISDTPLDANQAKEFELREMMRDPRYWQKREPEWVKRVTEGFRALVGVDVPLFVPPAPDGPNRPYWPVPEAKTLRDEFAMKLMERDFFGSKYEAEMLYRAVDAIMEARKK